MWRPLLLLLIVVVSACSGGDDESASSTPDSTTAPAVTVEPSAPGTTVVFMQPVAEISADHVDPPVSFEQSPSIGGPHYPFWHNCGFYDVELLEGAATHSMEHGAVWITYNADLVDVAGIALLRSMAEANPKLLVSPYDHPEPIVASAWGAQMRTSGGPGAPEVAAFIEEWVDNPELPEAGVTCQSALGVPPSDVRTLSDGSALPDEWN